MAWLSLLLLSLPLFTIVEATYSIVSTDLKTRQVGGAGASCVPSVDIFDALYWSAPNRSVLHTQGQIFKIEPIAEMAVEMMKNNDSIDDILTKMKESDELGFFYSLLFDHPIVELRQYGMADFNTNSHGGYTGKSLETVYESEGIENTEQIDVGVDRNDEDADESIRGRYSFHAQGNVVAEDTVTSLLDGFIGGDEDVIYQCDMAGRLMSAMSRVVERDLGDMRCINDHNGTSASGAFLHIDNADGTELIHLNIIGDGSFEPVEEMREEFLEWRKSNPCPVDIAAESTF